jgi:anti-sigma-K factor RskA
MTQTWDCSDARMSLGVYVLGAIDPAERALVDAHLTTCRDCRDELAGLAGLPALLARVNPDEISRIRVDDTIRTSPDEKPPTELLGTVLDLAAARRRRNRWRFAAAAAAVVAIAGGLFGGLRSATSTTRTVVAEQYPTGTAAWETAQTTSNITGTSATIRYAGERWGSAFEVAAWTVSDDEGRVWYPGSTSLSSAAIASFQITAGHQVLLAATPT